MSNTSSEMHAATLNGTSKVSGLSPSHILSTPIRAISSKISVGPTSSGPPSSDAYERLVKAVFRHRLEFSLFLSAAYTYVLVNVWTLWQAGGFAKMGLWGAVWLPINLWTICITLLVWVALPVPVVVLRKAFLTPQRLSASTPLSMVKTALSQRTVRLAMCIHYVSAICALAFYVMNSYLHSFDDPKLTLFVKSRKHPYYLNGRLLFLVITQVFTALAFVLRGALADRFVYRWSMATNHPTNWVFMVIMSFLVSVVNATLALVGGMFFFGLTRMLLPFFYSIPLLSIIFRPLTAHFLKGSWTVLLPFLHVNLVTRSFILSFSTVLVWELTDNLFDRVIIERANLSTITADPNTTLVSGTTSTNQIFKFFAYSELRHLAMEETLPASSRRTALFGDQKTMPNLWTCLSRESLVLLGQHYQLLLRRGMPLIVPIAPIPAKEEFTVGQDIATPTKLLRRPIYKNIQESPGQAALDALASDGPIAQALDAGADATHIPELFRSVETKVLVTPVAEETKKNVEHVKGLGSRIKDITLSSLTFYASRYIPEPVRDQVGQLLEWWKRERVNKTVEASLPFRELDVVVIDALSYLTCASLTEDRYGVVQRDIPKILEAMVSLLSAIDEYQSEINSKYKPASSTLSVKEQAASNALAVEVTKSNEILSYMVDSLKEGIARIARTFGDRLLAFKFPPPVAQKLQLFLEFA